MSGTGVKKHVVRLSAEKREALEAMISKGKGPASQLLKARILLKTDISDAGDGWSDERIVEALETSLSTVCRTRQLLVEDGLNAALKRKPRERASITPIFDGEAQARLIQLACSQAPAGHARWTLRLLEQKVVELGIVPRASDNTIGRVLKKRSQAAPEATMDDPARRQRGVRGGDGRRADGLHACARPGLPAGLPG